MQPKLWRRWSCRRALPPHPPPPPLAARRPPLGALHKIRHSAFTHTFILRPRLQLFERFRPGEAPPAALGASRDYNVDLVPKFIMVGGAGGVVVDALFRG